MDIIMIQNQLLCGNISYEEAKVLMEKEMTLMQMEKDYGAKVKQLPDGRWWIRLNGKVIKKTSREAIFEEIIKRQHEQNDLEFIKVAEKWLEIRKIEKAAGTWIKDYRFIQNYLYGSNLEHLKIDQVNYSDCVNWATWCLAKTPMMKSAYFKNMKSELSKLFDYALKENLISSNPARELSIHRDHFQKATKHEDNELIFLDSEKEAVKNLIYQEAQKKKDTVCLGILLLFNTGIRDGELNELRWGDIEDGMLHVQREYIESFDPVSNKFAGYKVVDHCKSDAGDRKIPLNKEALTVLQMQKEFSIANGYSVEKDDLIFRRGPQKHIQHCNTRCYETRIKRFCRLANMDVLKSQHDIRRTFCTNLYYTGMPLKNIQKLMGHSSLKQTMDYIKFKEDDKDVLLEQLNSI